MDDVRLAKLTVKLGILYEHIRDRGLVCNDESWKWRGAIDSLHHGKCAGTIHELSHCVGIRK